MVYSIALRLLRDPALAEELSQDVFLRLYGKLADLESDDHVKFWLRRVTVHRAIDEARRSKLRPKTMLDQIPEPVAIDRSADFLMDDKLRKLVAALPEKARAIVLLRFQEDMDPLEISRVLEMPSSSVKSLLHRTLRLLRGKLERTGTKSAKLGLQA
jgi:RNA polymerase sigma-70 factor (ECF subfamily)